MAEWLDKNLQWFSVGFLIVIVILAAAGVRGMAYDAIVFTIASFMVIGNLIAATYEKMNLAKAVIWTLLAVYFGWSVIR